MAFGLLLLSGCGGGSSSNDEGFRFVPEGSGAVIPYPNVHFEYTVGSVTSGVIVTAAPVTSGMPAPPDSTAALQFSAYRVTFSTPTVAFSPQAKIFLPFTADATQLSVPRIYLHSSAGWQVLAGTAPAQGDTTLQAVLPPVIESGSILAVYADGPPPVLGATGVPPVPVAATGP